jgi:hypothetical protein
MKSGITSGLKREINSSLIQKMDILALQIKNFHPHYQQNYPNANLTTVFFGQF